MKIPNLKEVKAMKEKSIESGIEYVKNGDFYIQNLTILTNKVTACHAKFIKRTDIAFARWKCRECLGIYILKKLTHRQKKMADSSYNRYGSQARYYRISKSKIPNGLG